MLLEQPLNLKNTFFVKGNFLLIERFADWEALQIERFHCICYASHCFLCVSRWCVKKEKGLSDLSLNMDLLNPIDLINQSYSIT